MKFSNLFVIFLMLYPALHNAHAVSASATTSSTVTSSGSVYNYTYGGAYSGISSQNSVILPGGYASSYGVPGTQSYSLTTSNGQIVNESTFPIAPFSLRIR